MTSSQQAARRLSSTQRLEILHRLALIAEKRGRIDEAAQWFREAAALTEDATVSETAAVDVLQAYMDFVGRTGRSEQFGETVTRLLERLDQVSGSYHWSMQLRYTLGCALLEHGQHAQGEAVFAAAIARFESGGREYSELFHKIVLRYGELLFQKENYAEAERVLRIAADLDEAVSS